MELEDPYSGWTSHDYRIEEAVLVLERDICKTCGNPTWLCHTSSSSVEFEIRSGWCYGKAELDDYNDSNEATKLESGEYRYAVAVGVMGEDEEREPLPTRAEALAVLASVTRKSP